MLGRLGAAIMGMADFSARQAEFHHIQSRMFDCELACYRLVMGISGVSGRVTCPSSCNEGGRVVVRGCLIGRIGGSQGLFWFRIDCGPVMDPRGRVHGHVEFESRDPRGWWE